MWDLRLCRLCGKISDSALPFFDKDKKPTFEAKVRKCLPIIIFEHDMKPKQVCLECIRKVEDFYDFIEISQTIDYKFETLIYERSTKWLSKQSVEENQNGVSTNKSDYPGNSNVFFMVEVRCKDDTRLLPALETLPPSNYLNPYPLDGKLREIESIPEHCTDHLDPVLNCSASHLTLYQSNVGLPEYTEKKSEPSLCASSTFIDGGGESLIKDSNQYQDLQQKSHDGEEETVCSESGENSTKLKSQNDDIPEDCNTSQDIVNTAATQSLHGAYVEQTVVPSLPTKPFSCIACQKTFMRRANLNAHMSIHTNIRPFTCEVCEKSYASKHELNVHMFMHSGEYTCEYCAKIFCARRKLVRHIRTHTGERPFKCQICTKAFADKRNLAAHMEMHSNHKPFQCTHCEKTFRVKFHLMEHQRVHNMDMPFICESCGRRFKWKANLTLHMRKHTGELFACQFCPSKFARSSQLTKHIQRLHSNHLKPCT